MREAVIVAGARTPIGRSKKGTLANTRPDDFGALVVKGCLFCLQFYLVFYLV